MVASWVDSLVGPEHCCWSESFHPSETCTPEPAWAFATPFALAFAPTIKSQKNISVCWDPQGVRKEMTSPTCRRLALTCTTSTCCWCTSRRASADELRESGKFHCSQSWVSGRSFCVIWWFCSGTTWSQLWFSTVVEQAGPTWMRGVQWNCDPSENQKTWGSFCEQWFVNQEYFPHRNRWTLAWCTDLLFPHPKQIWGGVCIFSVCMTDLHGHCARMTRIATGYLSGSNVKDKRRCPAFSMPNIEGAGLRTMLLQKPEVECKRLWSFLMSSFLPAFSSLCMAICTRMTR